MNVVIFGATGQTGRRLVQRALDDGHTVTAVARTPANLEISHDRLVLNRGDITRYDSITGSVQGQDAVISAVGGGRLLRRVTLYSEGVENIIAAMDEHGVSRFLAITAGGTRPGHDPNNPLFFELIVKGILLRRVYADMKRMEQIVENSDLDWTLIRPSGLSNAPGDGTYRVKVGYSVPESSTTTRDDLAEFIITELSTHAYNKEGVAVVTV